jgi:hypothetical protein
MTPGPDKEVEDAFGLDCRNLPSASIGICMGDRAATMLQDGSVLLAGGWQIELEPDAGRPYGLGPQLAGELLDTATWTAWPTGPLIEPRNHHSATLLADGRVLLIGGEAFRASGVLHRVLLSSAEIFTPK